MLKRLSVTTSCSLAIRSRLKALLLVKRIVLALLFTNLISMCRGCVKGISTFSLAAWVKSRWLGTVSVLAFWNLILHRPICKLRLPCIALVGLASLLFASVAQAQTGEWFITYAAYGGQLSRNCDDANCDSGYISWNPTVEVYQPNPANDPQYFPAAEITYSLTWYDVSIGMWVPSSGCGGSTDCLELQEDWMAAGNCSGAVGATTTVLTVVEQYPYALEGDALTAAGMIVNDPAFLCGQAGSIPPDVAKWLIEESVGAKFDASAVEPVGYDLCQDGGFIFDAPVGCTDCSTGSPRRQFVDVGIPKIVCKAPEEPEAGPESDPTSGGESGPETGSETSPETGGESGPETGPEVDVDPESGPELPPESGPEVAPETGSETSPETGSETSPEWGPEWGPTSDADGWSDIWSDVGPEVAPDVDPDTGPDTGPEENWDYGLISGACVRGSQPCPDGYGIRSDGENISFKAFVRRGRWIDAKDGHGKRSVKPVWVPVDITIPEALANNLCCWQQTDGIYLPGESVDWNVVNEWSRLGGDYAALAVIIRQTVGGDYLPDDMFDKWWNGDVLWNDTQGGAGPYYPQGYSCGVVLYPGPGCEADTEEPAPEGDVLDLTALDDEISTDVLDAVTSGVDGLTSQLQASIDEHLSGMSGMISSAQGEILSTLGFTSFVGNVIGDFEDLLETPGDDEGFWTFHLGGILGTPVAYDVRDYFPGGSEAVFGVPTANKIREILRWFLWCGLFLMCLKRFMPSTIEPGGS